jgi:predicted  nucleic acid-binding Zn-ribbon protein
MNELFELPESNPSRLNAARKAVERCEAECERLKESFPDYDAAPTPIKWEITEAKKKLEDAKAELLEAETEEISK